MLSINLMGCYVWRKVCSSRNLVIRRLICVMGNTRYFYMKQRRVSSFISKLVDPDGIEFSDPRVIENIFLNHFKGILAPQLEAVNSDLVSCYSIW